ncbi:GntR family transcriptional regulator [Cohnella sp. LGH]|uniref:GntR family transcriptional regulator n=1 Tax=Cohnella sp. LGH TaxID=1619153 RepID=UPI001AD9ED9D|nr:GntR family transcriptional regulator [Cohnella sp. LGH]QTH41612.1 GntR family transcriptional regulator [Cohnella sp. LGH]
MSGTKRTPLSEQVRAYVLDQIRAGKWREGSRLPSENQLCKQFDVSRITIRGAMDKLVEDGIVYRIQGRGSFVSRAKEGGEPIRYAGRPAENRGPQFVAVLIPRLRGLLMTRLVEGIEKALEGSPCRIMLMTTGDSQKQEEEKLKEALAAGAKGIIVYPSDGQTYNEAMLRLSLDRYPIVVIDRYLRGVETNCVCSDHYAGAYEATEHLLRLGHRRIAFVTSPYSGTTSLEERLEGYRQALNDYGVMFDRGRVIESVEPERLGAILNEQPDLTALFAANEEIGLIAMRMAEAYGRSVPQHLSVIFFDDYDHSQYARIPPTCVAQQGEEIGVQAGRRLLSLIGDPLQDRAMLRVPTKLIVRASSAEPPDGIKGSSGDSGD